MAGRVSASRRGQESLRLLELQAELGRRRVGLLQRRRQTPDRDVRVAGAIRHHRLRLVHGILEALQVLCRRLDMKVGLGARGVEGGGRAAGGLPGEAMGWVVDEGEGEE